MTATVEYPDGFPVFHDIFTFQSATVVISANKILEGWNFAEIPFLFELLNIATGETFTAESINGVVTFPEITFDTPGQYLFEIREITPNGDGWTTSTMVFPVIVNVFNNGAGELIAEIEYPAGEPTFINVYKATAIEVIITATKEANLPLNDNQFEFGLYLDNAILVETAFNNADGNIVFPPLAFDQPGTFIYIIKEITPSGSGWTTDRREFTIVIDVIDNEFGLLIANISYPDGQPIFFNEYNTEPITIFLSATKLGIGAALTEGQFMFQVRDEFGNIVATGTNTAAIGINGEQV